jgi:hypothetical protein
VTPDRSPRAHRTDSAPIRAFSVVVFVLVVLLATNIYIGVQFTRTLDAAHSKSSLTLAALATNAPVLVHNQFIICHALAPKCKTADLWSLSHATSRAR